MSNLPFSEIIGHATIVRLLSSSIAHPAPAYVFVGRSHLGKRTIARGFVDALLERSPSYEEGAEGVKIHPDLIVLAPEEGKKLVSVEQVRDLRERVSMKPMLAPRVVVFVPSADRLNEAGTNALLKVLEEPPADAVFVLVAEDVGRLPATVLSRSVVMPFQLVATTDIERALIDRGVAVTDAVSLSVSAHGCPGLAIEPQEGERMGARFIGSFFAARTLGSRLAMIDDLAAACEAEEDTQLAWRDVLLDAMSAMHASLSAMPAEGSVFGVALLQAMRMVGSAVSPRVALDAGAVRMSNGHAIEEAMRLQPAHVPRVTPLFFNELI